VSDAIQRFRETGSYAKRSGQGRRRVTNAVEDRFLRLQSLRERTLPATALSRRLANVHDESRFTRYSPDRCQRVFRRPGERYA
ncbi:unnamed protein product, partial [Tenebrio molitor]